MIWFGTEHWAFGGLPMSPFLARGGSKCDRRIDKQTSIEILHITPLITLLHEREREREREREMEAERG